MPLTYERQTHYRERYRQQNPGWQPATSVYEATIRAALQAIGSDARLIDIGCGRGGVLEHLGDVSFHAYGLEADFMSLVEHRLPDLPRVLALANALPLPDASMDIAVSTWVLEHLSDPQTAFRETSRVLKPDGRFIFITPNKHNHVVMLNRLLKPLQHVLVPLLYGRESADTFPVCYEANTPRRIQALAVAAGMHLETCHIIHDPTYLAFNEPLFKLSQTVTRLLPASMGVHLVGVCRRI